MISTVLCIGPYKRPSNAYIRTKSFEAIGYKVERVNVSDNLTVSNVPFRILRKLFLRPLFRRMLVSRVKKKMMACSPILVFIEKGVDFDASNLIDFRKILPAKSKIVHINPDDPFGFFRGGWGKFISAIPHYDVHFIPKELNRQDYVSLCAKSVHVYDRAFDPKYHKPSILSETERSKYECDVGFIGSYAKQRESVIYEMICSGIDVTLWGDGWSKGRHWPSLKKYWRGGTQINENYIKAICGMKIALHFVRHENRDLHDSRTFEIPACGTFMLTERTSDHERLFSENEEIVMFDSAADCIEKCRYYLTNDDTRQRISESAMKKLSGSNYDYTSRLRGMLELI
jgi:spore maturation protein CgeB